MVIRTLQTVSTLPSDYDGQKWASAIKLSADGKFLYALTVLTILSLAFKVVDTAF